MSFKTLFDKAQKVNSLSNKSAKEIGGEVESVGYHKEDIINEKRYIPGVDFSDPATFARYGSAEEYYIQSIERVYDTYPYDGSLRERLKWENESTYIDLHIFDNLYPRTNGYAIVSAGGWGSTTKTSGYGLPSSLEYIYFEGGPHPNPNGMSPYSTNFTGSNYYDASTNRESNLKYDLQGNGVTVEFWLNKTEFLSSLTEKEVIFDLWNGAASGSTSYGRLTIELSASTDGTTPFLVTAQSGTSGIYQQSVAATTFTTASLADGSWHHYAISLRNKSGAAGIETKFYVDGTINSTAVLGSSHINEVTGALRAYIGAIQTAPSGTSVTAGSGKLSGSLDEFRYWKTQRSSKDIGRYFISQIGGGTNSDPEPFSDTQEDVNTKLGVYYKFNEGITGDTSIDSVVLDYSGRVSNGTWTGYGTTSRNTGSAIVLSNAATKEFLDPIIRPSHPEIVSLRSELSSTGSAYDAGNNASIYNSIPAWITEEDSQGEKQTKYLTQIISSYFDTLHIQTSKLNTLRDVEYVSGSRKPFPYSYKKLNSFGFVAPDIFLDADILEKLADRSEDRLYEKSLNDIKNIIYQNIYNNLTYIYKTKGTEKSFRNLIRSFGIDDELIKLSMYSQNSEYEYRENRRNVLVSDKLVNFNNGINTNAVVYSFSSSANPNSTGAIPAATQLTGGYAITLETDVTFPTKPSGLDANYFFTNAISSSVFGVHGALADQTDTTWAFNDEVNFQVLTIRDELESNNAYFMLTGTAGGYVPMLTSSLYEELYSDTTWNLSVRIKPEDYPLAYFVDGATTGSYTVVFTGIGTRSGEVVNEFSVSSSVTAPPNAFISGSRRVFLGAHRTNVTGAVLQTSDVKVNSCRFWLNYVEDEALREHALDTENHGSLRPSLYAFPWDTDASFGEVSKLDTLAFNWEFSQNTGSNASGEFTVADESSGSATLASTRFGWIGNVVNKQVTAKGEGFEASSTSPIKKDFIVAARLNELESIAPAETVTVLSAQDQKEFKIDSRPINYYFAFEKSMSKVISEEMINSFGNLKDFNNLIGDAVNRYRSEYKALKFVRQKFFEKVGNDEIDFDRFYEFYKWFDSSLSFMLGQLVPASADFAENVRTIVESHALERSKYRNVFPFIDDESNVFEATASSNVDYGDSISSPDDDPAGTGFYPAHAPRKRSVGLSTRDMVSKWKYVHAPVDGDQTKNYLWWKNKAERDEAAITEATDVNNSRGAILKAIDQVVVREQFLPYRFSIGGSKILGGVGMHQNKDVNFVFQATQPSDALASGTNAPLNVMVAAASGVETLLDTTDEFFPSYKQRLGYELDPTANDSSTNLTTNGNKIAPFSLYKTTEQSTFNSTISSSFKAGVTITNLHHDLTFDLDIPAQGPFTERHVGGRFYRHTDIGNGTDSSADRAEGFKILFDGVSSSAGGTFTNSLAIVPPNNTGTGASFGTPTAQRFRDETAKRPVNIRNIRYTTASQALGNFQRNYEVIQTAGRSLNDPFFNDQSFAFAPNPETLATRGRFPLYEPDPIIGKSYLFDGSNDYATATNTTTTEWNDLIGSSSSGAKPYSMSWWMYANSWGANDVVIAIGQETYGRGREIRLFDDVGLDGFRAYPGFGGYRATATNMTTGVWYHCVATFAGMSENYGGTVVMPDVYVNGALDNGALNPSSPISRIGAIGNQPLSVGWNQIVSNSRFDGYICDVTIYNKELSSDEVVEIYNGGARSNPLQSPVASNVVVYYPMGNDPADTYNTQITDLGADNLSGFSNPSNLVPKNLAANAITTVSPSNLSGDEFPEYAGPLNKVSENTGGNLNYALPARTGSNSNKTVIVNRFAGCGYEVMSRGYMDPAHEELSVYNALPYRDLSIRDYGLSGSASVDPLAARTITIVDQIDKNRGLNQRASLHAGPFGSDAAYGSVPASTYVTTPSWHKTNRNPLKRLVALNADNTSYFTASVYDNLFVQHSIPRSTQQYSWVTASLASGQTTFGLQAPTRFSASALTELITSGSDYSDLTFVGLITRTVDPLTASSHILGFPLSVDASASYNNDDYWTQPALDTGADYFNFVITGRNGPWGYPTWKQIRTGETKVARKLRQTNQIGLVTPPPLVPVTLANGVTYQKVRSLRSNGFVDYTEQPISSRYSPTVVLLEDNTEDSNPINNIAVRVAYGNELDYFSNEPLNNRLNIPAPDLTNNSLNRILQFVTSSQLSTIIDYKERVYPSEINVYKNAVRRRTEYTISNIWNDTRSERSTAFVSSVASDTTPNSQGRGVYGASIWPLDAHSDFTSTFSGPFSMFPLGSEFEPIVSGSGELLNPYTRFYNVTYGSGVGTVKGLQAAATYASRVPAGSSSADTDDAIFVGDAEWLAGQQSGKKPYESYSSYSERIALVGKDHSIVPEFRISELIETYVDTNSEDFLADVDNALNLTGAVIYDSSDSDFFKTYTNSDFMKYFSVVDNSLHDKRSGDLKIQRDKLSLSCDAMIKFLPYKGFYPAERTLELASILSQSYGEYIEVDVSSSTPGTKRIAVFRAFVEPLMAPGILFNTIKSGIGVSNYVLSNTSTDASSTKLNSAIPTASCNQTDLPEGTVQYNKLLNVAGNDATIGGNNGYQIQKLPFEALQRPLAFLERGFISGSGAIYDTGISDQDELYNRHLDLISGSDFIKINAGKKLYELAIDNFLCETTNFFMDGLASFRSKREDQFKPVTSGSVYRMRMDFFRTLDSNLNVDRNTFDLYGRESAFGYPIGQGYSTSIAAYRSQSASFNHVVPAYYHGAASVDFVYTAQYTGLPTLDEILSNTTITHTVPYPHGVQDSVSVNIADSWNLTNFFTEVPEGTREQKKVWLIQSKFETPVLNFANVTTSSQPASNVDTGLSSSAQIKTNGMWHQYGTLPTAENEGIFLRIKEGAPAGQFSLAEIVGFEAGIPIRVGKPKPAGLLEEAVIAIPFKTVNNRREFFPIEEGNSEYENIEKLLKKYVFPPKFDFVINKTVTPVLMYGFEFSATLTQKDITDMWQNLPPEIGEKFEQKKVIIEDKQVLELLASESDEIQWMVFKAKKRAAKSFDKFRRSLETSDTSAFPDAIGDYSYNWPYDYFSLVELVKIEESVRYASEDIE